MLIFSWFVCLDALLNSWGRIMMQLFLTALLWEMQTRYRPSHNDMIDFFLHFVFFVHFYSFSQTFCTWIHFFPLEGSQFTTRKKQQQQQQQTNKETKTQLIQQNNVSSAIRYSSWSFARSFYFQLVSFFTSRGQLHDALLVAQVAYEGGISLPPKKEAKPLDLKKNDILPSLTNFMTDENKGWAIVMQWCFSAGSKASFMLQITVF